MAVELRQAGSEQVLHRLMLEDVPQPGRWLEVEGLSYLVLQRRHRYRLRGGRYQLSGVALMVKAQKQPADSRWWNDRWVIGDPSCRFNARSPRCAAPCCRKAHASAAATTASAELLNQRIAAAGCFAFQLRLPQQDRAAAGGQHQAHTTHRLKNRTGFR